MATVMTRNPVQVLPVGRYPSAVPAVVASDPDLPARGPRAYINRSKSGDEGQTDTQNQQFHSFSSIPFFAA
jgi:hypothetical protein